MITLHSAQARHCSRVGAGEVRRTFDSHDAAGPVRYGFGALVILDEELLPPGAAAQPRAPHDGETLVYVREGGLLYTGGGASSVCLLAGEFRQTSGGGSETNASRTDWARVFRIGLRAAQTRGDVGHESKRFGAAERRGRLRVVASPDASRGSLSVQQDVLIYSALLDPGQHVVHELAPGRSAWIHLLEGEANAGGTVLSTADGAAVSGERCVSLTARAHTEILLFDLSAPSEAYLGGRPAP